MDGGPLTYYPFGWMMPDRTVLQYRYGYQGQELDEETGWTAFQLRMYDGRLGRWMSVDPYREFHSPYLAMGNAPVTVTDPDGGFTRLGAWLFALLHGGKVSRDPSGGHWNVIGNDGTTHAGRPRGGSNGQGSFNIGNIAKGSLAFAGGAANAFASNQLMGIGRMPEDQLGDDLLGNLFKGGQFFGDLFTILLGVPAGTSAGAVTVVATPTGVGIPVAVASAAVAAQQAGAITTAASNVGETLRDARLYIKKKNLGEGGFEKMPRGHNTKKNQEVRSLGKQYRLTDEQMDIVHRAVSKKNFTRAEIEQYILDHILK